jgi:hypothetical protein
MELTYSFVMRQLNKNDKKKMKEFMKSYKSIFDKCIVKEVENFEEICLMQAMKDCNITEEDLND